MDNSIFRLRPIGKNTLSELEEPYLWFSKPTGFKDVEDANIAMFIERNDIVKRALSQILTNEGIQELSHKMKHIGICCFTMEIPTIKAKEKFPKGFHSLVIEFDKTKVSDYFLNSPYAISDCFHPIVYTDNAIKVTKNGDYHYLYSFGEWGQLYKSIKELMLHPRYIDQFIFFLLTRLKSKFAVQKEERIILAGHNIKNFDDSILGYKVSIPKGSIKRIHFYSDTDMKFVEDVKKLGYNVEIIDNSRL